MIRALLASPLGLLIGLSVGALGSGGSILAVPALVYAAGQTPQAATATSLVLVGVAALSVLPGHHHAGRVQVGAGVAFGLTGIAGSVAGTWLNQRLDPNLLLVAFSGLILVAAWRMLTACPSCTKAGEARALDTAPAPVAATPVTVKRALVLLVAGSAVGFLTGLFGVGGGFVIVPVLTLLFGYAMPQAIGTSLLVVAINSAVALLARLGTVQIDWTVALLFTLTAILGAQFGRQIADRIDPEQSLRVFAVGLLLLAFYTGGRALAAL